ncbi:DUF3800 domain-containing protein [Nautilia sp.]
MKIEVYCDENLPDLFTSQKAKDKYMFIGGIWIDAKLRDEIKAKVKELRKKYNCFGEIKWVNVTPSKEDFYKEIVKLFFTYNENQVRFRTIMIEAKKVIWSYHQEDKELGFYKFYYQMLNKWISDYNEYKIFVDVKKNRDLTRLKILKEVLTNSSKNSYIERVQALPSKEVVLIQLADLLIGAVSAKLNNKNLKNKAKVNLISYIENFKKIEPTYKAENKFNIFKIRLEGSL